MTDVLRNSDGVRTSLCLTEREFLKSHSVCLPWKKENSVSQGSEDTWPFLWWKKPPERNSHQKFSYFCLQCLLLRWSWFLLAWYLNVRQRQKEDLLLPTGDMFVSPDSPPAQRSPCQEFCLSQVLPLFPPGLSKGILSAGEVGLTGRTWV